MPFANKHKKVGKIGTLCFVESAVARMLRSTGVMTDDSFSCAF
jgi:hypothetical protein